MHACIHYRLMEDPAGLHCVKLVLLSPFEISMKIYSLAYNFPLKSPPGAVIRPVRNDCRRYVFSSELPLFLSHLRFGEEEEWKLAWHSMKGSCVNVCCRSVLSRRCLGLKVHHFLLLPLCFQLSCLLLSNGYIFLISLSFSLGLCAWVKAGWGGVPFEWFYFTWMCCSFPEPALVIPLNVKVMHLLLCWSDEFHSKKMD